MPKQNNGIALGLTMAVILLALVIGAGGTVFAQPLAIGGTIQCQGRPCIATGDGDVLFERVGDGVPDRMLAQGDHDLLRADTYTDDRDVAKGGSGNDTLRVDDGDIKDLAIGGAGYDTCVVDFGAEASHTCEVVSFD
jgi:Ca2+-binding RTX toxin-like protein